MHYSPLPHRGLLKLSGVDAGAFLQGLVSNDVLRLQEGRAVYAAMLSPQGKFLHDFFVIRRQDDFLLDMDKAHLPELAARLKIYKLRSKVAIEAPPEAMGVAALWENAGFSIQDAGMVAFTDPRLPALGHRVVGDIAAMEAHLSQAGSKGDYERLRLELGVPDGARDMIEGKSLLLEFGFEDLHGVDFQKGCYVGQEVTARSKYRAELRKFIYRVKADDTLPPAGTPVMCGDAAAGELRSSQGNIGLALLRVEEVAKAQTLSAGGTVITASLPSWVKHAP